MDPELGVSNNNSSSSKRKGRTEDGVSQQNKPLPNRSKKRKTGTYFVALHLGCGRHSLQEKAQERYRTLCRSACSQALKVLQSGGSADNAVVAATVILENSELVNAGKGSELNLDKKVECDAGFMNGTGCFGGVGCVPGVANPILIARKIAQLQLTRENLMDGVVPPNLLTGDHAKTFAARHGIATCEGDTLISKRAVRNYEKYMKALHTETDSACHKATEFQHSNKADQDDELQVNDTIGVIALDSNDHVAATVSSGGNQLKFPGRVGHSPIFGCGCWASDKFDNNSSAIAVSTTGVGEMLTKTRWAFECANCLSSEKHDNPIDAMSFAIKTKFLESPLLRFDTENKLIGGVALVWDGKRGELIWGYRAPTFIFSYAGNKYPSPQTTVLSTEDKDEVSVGGMCF